MELLTWGRDPWGEWVLTHISWNLFWAALVAGALFLVAHASYMLFIVSAHRKRAAADTERLEAAHANLPQRIERHSVAARIFHWVMAASMLVLLFTAFLPPAGVQFAWVTWHWIAGLVLTASIVFHVVHASVWLDFWSIWIHPREIPDLKAELLRELGRDVPAPKPAKYPLGNRLYHYATAGTGVVAVVSGLLMMTHVQTPFLTRNPYLLSDSIGGLTYVAHGLAGVGLVGLVIAHVYFAARPEKWWITKSMVVGWITRRQYLEHHEPSRWVIKSQPARPAGPR